MRVAALVLLLSGATGESLEDVEREAVQLGGERGIDLVERWISGHPRNEALGAARLWQAQQLVALRRYDAAQEKLGLALELAHDEDLRWDVRLTMADLLSQRGAHAAAHEAYANLHAPAGSRWEFQASLRARHLEEEGARASWAWWLGTALVLLTTWRTWSARRKLWPPPLEVSWALPVLGVLAAAGLSRPEGEREAVEFTLLGGLVLLWCQGARLAGRPLTRWGRATEVVVALVSVAGLLYCSVVAAGLWARVMDTLVAGAE